MKEKLESEEYDRDGV